MFLLLSSSSYSQSASDAYLNMDDAAAPGTLYAGTYIVFLTDTSNVSQIEIALGTGTGLSDVMTQIYNYDVTSGLPSGYTYTREGNKLTLGIGNYTEYNTYFGSVRIKNVSGTWSSSFNFITN
ncbi:MAG: hypothetical protein IPJ79_01095 [Bacteroidetes bacterium]|nr:hypothetical protein [Bacteroidota bacterium]